MLKLSPVLISLTTFEVVKTFVGITDRAWARFLVERPNVTEVNFWQPGGGRNFKVLQRGEPFLFKSKWEDGNQLIGGGYFEGFVKLRVSEAWDFFGEGNGVSSLSEMVRLIGQYRDIPQLEDPEIGCVLLNDVRFVDQSMRIAAPDDFSKNIVSGKSYAVGGPDANPVIDFFVKNLAVAVEAHDPSRQQPREVPGPVFGEPRLVRPRLGQGGFKSLVREAYDRRCAITGHKIVPTLQAAHIVPVSQNGENRIDNGLLLRSDVHTLFYKGYVGVAPDYTLHVSPRLRSEFGNGDELYSRAGETIAIPSAKPDRPNSEFLEWHMDSIFLGS